MKCQKKQEPITDAWEFDGTQASLAEMPAIGFTVWTGDTRVTVHTYNSGKIDLSVGDWLVKRGDFCDGFTNPDFFRLYDLIK